MPEQSPRESEFGGYGTIFIGARFSDEQIAHGFATLFELEPAVILVDRDMYWAYKDLEGIEVVCTIFDKPGEFPTHLELTILNTKLSLPKELSQIAKLCAALDAPCVVEPVPFTWDDYIWVLVQQNGSSKKVWVDEAMLNEEAAITIGGELDD